jgi:hypothetical protein
MQQLCITMISLQVYARIEEEHVMGLDSCYMMLARP